MPTQAPLAGHISEFDHDGFEFTEEATDIVDYTEKLLNPDARKLVEFASHMHFIENDPMIQWWIRQFSSGRRLRDLELQ